MLHAHVAIAAGEGRPPLAAQSRRSSLPQAPTKASCVHPARPVSSACGDCPRRKRMAAMAKAMAKSKCVHPNRPVSSACADCPRRK